MRVSGQFAVILCVCGTLGGLAAVPSADQQAPPSAAHPAPATDERAAKVLADARAALGGEAKLAAVKSFTTTGRTQRVQGNNLLPIEFEILVELPAKYLRKDEIPAQESDPTTIGFNGSALVQIPPPAPPEPRPGMPAPPPGMFENMLKQRALTARQDFARLMLGMFATSFEAYPLTFKYIGQAEAPQGKAHVLEATGESDFKIKFFVHMETSLPVMVSWSAPASARATAGRPAPAGEATAGRPAAPAPAPASAEATAGRPSTQHPAPAAPPENRLYFADYRDVDGIKLPFRLRRGVGVNTTEETTFDRFRLNQKIDPRRFEVRK